MLKSYALVLMCMAAQVALCAGTGICSTDAVDLTPVVEADAGTSQVDTLLDEYEAIGNTFEAALRTTTNQTVMLDAYNEFTAAVQEWTGRWKQAAAQVPIEDLVRVKIRLDSLSGHMKELITKGVPSAGEK